MRERVYIKGERLLSIDALRGFDMSFIMGGELVVVALCRMFPCNFTNSVAMNMGHVAWDGFTFYDLIFPLFLFLAGCSSPFSLNKQLLQHRSKRQIATKVIQRGILLVLLGLLYNGLLDFDFHNLRYASVLGRIGVAWAVAALLYMWLRRGVLVSLALSILLGYSLLLAFVAAPDAAGTSSLSMEGSIVGYIDRMLLPGTLHNEIHDPEGVLSTLPAIVTALLGMFTGEFVRSSKLGEYKKVALMLLFAALLLIVGYSCDTFAPINKNLWSSTFVCCAGGWSLMLFALFYFVIDVLGCKALTFPLCVIGANSITIYLAQRFFDFRSLVESLFGGILGLLPENCYTLGYWCSYMVVCWLLLYFLYRNKIFLKV